jgi:hypothetical protein
MMKRFLAGVLLVAGVGALAQTTNKVPDTYAVRLLRLRLDQESLKNRIYALSQQYSGLSQAISHDDEEIASVKKEALDAAKKGDDWDIDINKMEFVAKAPSAPAPKPLAPAKPGRGE